MGMLIALITWKNKEEIMHLKIVIPFLFQFYILDLMHIEMCKTFKATIFVKQEIGKYLNAY